ncbi:MAG: CinA family nicotinamide mononucleotide deamidase-related protein [Bacteroidetes bacterium]|nr:CinA family nicotinamide mononucleotide deamidase-related protein [Bacteroidota bacterium]
MRVHLLSIGDELLLGQTVNTNAAWMGRKLTEDGWRVSSVSAISDSPEAIREALDRGLAEADAVLITGGLGPTKDDLTKHVLAEHFGTELVMHEDIAAGIQAWFESRNVPFLEVNRLQAMLPRDCTVLPNPLGTASGMWFERPGGKVVVSMPGVPYEMEGLMLNEVLPRLRSHFELPTTLYQTVVTAGIGESSLAELVAEWEDALPAKGVSLAYLPSPGQVKVRLGVQGPAEDREALQTLLNDEVEAFVALAEKHVIGRGDSGLPEAVLSALKERGQTACTAESCTGGTVASMLTAVPGASAAMWGGVVAYDNSVKVAQLGVAQSDLDAHGAVSEPVVLAMARGARERLGTTWAVSTSGIAGPTGGTPEKPVGTVWMAVSGPDGERAWCHRFGSQRERIIQRAARRILTHLHHAIQEGGVKGLEE